MYYFLNHFFQNPGNYSERLYKRNEFLIKEGESNDAVFFVEKGALKIFTLIEDKEQIIRFAYSGSLVSALDTFISGTATQYYIQALKNSTVKMLSKNKFEQLLAENPKHLKQWNDVLLQLIKQMMEREIDLLTQSPIERYKNLLERSPRVFQEIPLKYIASYLRMSPETLSRIQKS